MNQSRELFEFITELQLEQDLDYYDPEYGNYKYRIVNDISLIEAAYRIQKFNNQYGRKIVPTLTNNNIYIYL